MITNIFRSKMEEIEHRTFKNPQDPIFPNLESGWTKSAQLDHPLLIPVTVSLLNLKLQLLAVVDGSQDLLQSKILKIKRKLNFTM